MGRTTVHRSVALLLAILAVCLSGEDASAQDTKPSTGGAPPVKAQVWKTSNTPDGYTVWRKTVDSGCQYADHNYTLDIPADPADMSDITYSMSNHDVDYNDPQGCTGGPEVDIMYFNGKSLGILTGANDSWSVNSWSLSPSHMVKGQNTIRIDTDAPGTGCWCVGVGYIQVRAKVGFKVSSHTPQADDKNRDFHASKVDLTVTFSKEYDPASLTADTFRLEYRDDKGAWQKVGGGFTQLAPERFRFTPSADLKDGIRYRVTVKGGASGVKGKEEGQLDADESWSFHTVPDLSLTNAFNYGSGSTCAPSASPCPGVDLTVFQVARNATLVPGKEAVARVYLRWNKHNDVHPKDQVTEVEFDVSIALGRAAFGQIRTMKRPDLYTPKQREAAEHTVNLRHTPADTFSYSAQVTPHPQTNATPVKFTQTRNLNSSGKSPRIDFDYYLLKDGPWAGGVPAAEEVNGLRTLNTGAQLVTDQFPVLGTRLNAKGTFTIGYTYTGGTTNNSGSCAPPLKLVDCGWWMGTVSELDCVYDTIKGMQGGHRFVAATLPSSVCPGVTGLRRNNVFFHFAGTTANDGTIAHEVGHVYGISKANDPTPKHRIENTKIEGFKVRTGTNYSYVENVTPFFSLMDPMVQDSGKQWIDNRDYEDLIGEVGLSAARHDLLLASSSAYLIISGYIDLDAGTARLAPSFVQELPNDPPEASGTCRVELRNAAGGVLSEGFVTPGGETSADLLNGTHVSVAASAAGPEPFSISLPWNDSARTLRVSCQGTVLQEKTRSDHPPAVDFTGLSNGAILRGTQVVSWAGSDADGDRLAYQLQLSGDGGASWSPVSPLTGGLSHGLNTALVGSGAKLLRIMATDGFDTVWSTRAVTFVNALGLVTTLPTSAEQGVELSATVSALFATDLDAATVSAASFQLLESGSQPVPGTVRYHDASRMVLFTPATRLKAGTAYTARLQSSLKGTDGSSLGAPYEWSFSTAGDTTAPTVVRTSPAPGTANVPLNALVQVTFSEPIQASPQSNSLLELQDATGQRVSGSVTVSADRQKVLFTASTPLQPEREYTAIVPATVTDLAGNPLGAAASWTFTTGTAPSTGPRIVGNYSDKASDLNGDTLFDQLTLSVDVEVLTPGYYNLNGRLKDKHGTLLEWQTTQTQSLARGVHTLTLTFSSVPIRSNGVDGPYTLDALNFYDASNAANGDVKDNAYQTHAYLAASFYSALRLSNLPDQLLEWNTTREKAFNLRDYTSHETQPISSVVYSIQSNTDPRVGVSIAPSGEVNIRPQPGVEAESDVVILARDGLNNRVTSGFHVSVQQPRPSTLDVPEELVLAPQQGLPFEVRVKDQWGRLLTSPVTVTFATTVGDIQPASVTTSTGVASTTLTSGSLTATGFVTTRVGAFSALTRVRIEGGGQPSWRRTGNLSHARALHEAVRLEDGGVLVVGGWTAVAELYDPTTGTWQAAGRLAQVRRNFTLTLLSDGRVLAVGGSGGKADTSAELYTPATRSWSRTGAMAVARKDHTSVLLANGKVLVAGGAGSDRSAELYDPVTGTWSRAGVLGTARSQHTATLLRDGTVLVAGGVDAAGVPLTSAERYDPATGQWSSAGAMTLARRLHTATPLANGQLLIAGGGTDRLANTAELYDPTTRTWRRTGSMAQPRRYHTATLLRSGKLLVAGGFDERTGIHPTAELYDPTTGTWQATAPMNEKRYDHTATLLADGRVLATGGQSEGAQPTTELFAPTGF